MFATPLADNKTPLEPLGGESIPPPCVLVDIQPLGTMQKWQTQEAKNEFGTQAETICKHYEFASK
jgi:hypothetical protein